MGTRGCIARRTGKRSFAGVYHHWDAYPNGLGKTLVELYQGHFKRDLPRMLKGLIDEHPAGWSSILDADWTQEPGYVENGFTTNGPHCYCHGGRSEEPWEVTEQNASGSGCEYAYVFTESKHMLVLSSYCEDGKKMVGFFGCGDPEARWTIIADIDLEAPEPLSQLPEAKQAASLQGSVTQ